MVTRKIYHLIFTSNHGFLVNVFYHFTILAQTKPINLKYVG